MSASWVVGGLTPAAVESFAALQLALARLADEGRTTPCQGRDGHLWTSDDADDLEAAAYRCQSCPLLIPCKAHAEHERHNTWGARDRGPRPKKETR